jgi:outer membrane protein assembly factor BamD (BamD/ComL family)
MMKTTSFFSLLILVCVSIFAAPMEIEASKLSVFKTPEASQIYLAEHYNKGCEAYNEQRWIQAIREFEKVTLFFPDSEEAADAYYFLGVCFFELQEYDFANEAFSNYIKGSGNPEFFENAVTYKFCIAEHFKEGKKRRLFKMRYCPKWATGRSMALSVYDEVIIALPNHEIAAQALYSKGCFLQSMKEYRDSVEAFQTLIRRFPKHELTPYSYLKIAESYCLQSRYEFQNPDLLALAEINARKFKGDFPRDERVEVAEEYVNRMREIYAKGLLDIAQFYERVQAPSAAAIYYQNCIEQFPETGVSDFCRKRVVSLGYESPDEETSPCPSTEFEAEIADQDLVQLPISEENE